MFEISNPCVYWTYLAVAIVMSVTYGIGCYTALQVRKEDMPKTRGEWWHQFWLNGLGVAVGWLAGWVVIVRWLSCHGFVCQGEPGGWTILLALVAFAGMTGHLPLTLITSIAAIRALLAKWFPAETGQVSDKPKNSDPPKNSA